jgi:hypothetical protein
LAAIEACAALAEHRMRPGMALSPLTRRSPRRQAPHGPLPNSVGCGGILL